MVASCGRGKYRRGFSLIELAVVLIVLAYLLNQIVTPFAAQYELAKRQRTTAQMQRVIDAAIGFAIAMHRLPCPAGAQTDGWERSACEGTDAIGFVPAVTLGINGAMDAQGRLLDAWGRPLVYVVSSFDHAQRGEPGKPDFVSAGEIGSVGPPYLNSALTVCSRVLSSACPRSAVRANQLPLLVLSLGADASSAGQQAYNQDLDSVYVAQTKSGAGSAGFDDLLLWLSESRLIFELVRAGTL